MMDQITVIKPDDFHVHVREGELLRAMVEATAENFARALIMPNLTPPIVTAAQAVEYASKIYRILLWIETPMSGFEPLMTIKLVPKTSPSTIVEAKERGVTAGKLYPEGVTTNSAGGVRDFKAMSPTFATMEEVDLVLCLHGEAPGEDVFCLDREERFLETLDWILTEFPGLRVVMEHLSTAAAANYVHDYPGDNLGATVTVHHLMLTLDDVIGDKLQPHNFCKPVAKRPHDRERLLQAVTEPRQTKFFLGTDSAPHLRGDKECDCGAAGAFTALTALQELAEIFDGQDALDRLEQFTSVNGACFYGLPLNEGEVTLVRKESTVPKEYFGVVPYRAGQKLEWSVKDD